MFDVYCCWDSSSYNSITLMIQVDLSGQLHFPLNQHFKPMVFINHGIHPFDGEWNVIPCSFVNYKRHVMIICTCL
jgi:hypothetical protein